MSHAVCEDMCSPSLEAWNLMMAGAWEEDPYFEKVPDEAQISQTQKMRVGIEFFAENGFPQNSYCTVNNLNDGIWEFKLGKIRISFFDTDGLGYYTPKLRIRDIRDADYPDDDFWWLPDFDVRIRLGHCFGKETQQTEPADLFESERVRQEDLQHDRT